MAIDYHRLKQRAFPELRHAYGTRDTMLYALALGLGSEALAGDTLPFVYEGVPGGLRILPTQAVVMGYPGFWAKQPDSGIAWVKLVHGEQRLRVHRPLPPAGTVVAQNRITHVIDKGPGKGAIVVIDRRIADEQGEAYATLQQVSFCRGDGGYSALMGGQPSDEPLPALAATPEGDATIVDDHATRPEMALLYRLLADDNPLHADPQVARSAGFERPILHGLATYGVAAHAIVRRCCANEPARLRSLDVRFSAPVYPGETLRTEIWHDGSRVQFRARALERNVVVLSHGRAEIA